MNDPFNESALLNFLPGWLDIIPDPILVDVNATFVSSPPSDPSESSDCPPSSTTPCSARTYSENSSELEKIALPPIL